MSAPPTAVDALSRLHEEYGHPVICSFHPRTRAKVEAFGVDVTDRLHPDIADAAVRASRAIGVRSTA